jgi:tetratricopeptide (TPR) repeat protein
VGGDHASFGELQAKVGQKAEALASYRKAVEIELVRAMKEPYGGLYSLPYLPDSCAKAGLREECPGLLRPASDLARTIAADWTRVSALIAKLETQLAPGKTKNAAAMFAQLVAMAQAVFNEHKRVEALAAIGRAQTAAGMAREAQATFELAERAAQALGDQSLRYSIDSIKKHPDLNKPERARDAMRAIRDYWTQLRPLVNIAKAQAKAGSTAEAGATFAHALKAMQAVTDKYIQASGIADIAKAQAEVTHFVEALRTAVSAPDTRAGGGGDNTYDRWAAFKEIAEWQLKAGLATEAAATLDHALKVARTSGDNHNRASLLAGTSKLLVKAGLTRDAVVALDEAVQAMRSEKMGGLTRSVLTSIADGQTAAGLVREAAATIERIVQANVDESGGWSFPDTVFGQIAIALAK